MTKWRKDNGGVPYYINCLNFTTIFKLYIYIRHFCLCGNKLESISLSLLKLFFPGFS